MGTYLNCPYEMVLMSTPSPSFGHKGETNIKEHLELSLCVGSRLWVLILIHP